MDIQSEVENERFLILFGAPYKSMCKLVTLKSGVIIIAIYDLIVGVLAFIEAIMYLIAFFRYGWMNFFYFMHLSMLSIRIVAIPFAMIGIRGMTKIVPDDISKYSRFKIFELIALTVFYTMENVYIYMDTSDLVLIVILVLAIQVLAGGFVKVVWSADTRMKYNETILVMHGEDALRLMQTQAANLAMPKVITPGMPIYVSPPYQQP